MTNIAIIPKYSYVKPSLAYVYMHTNSLSGKVFYVGKGNGRRGWCKDRSEKWNVLSDGEDVIITIVQDNMTDSSADLLETCLIAKLRNEGFELANLASGGNSNLGWTHTEKSKKIMSELKSGKNHHNYGKKLPRSTVIVMSKLASGAGNPFYGKKHTEYTKQKISKAHIGEKNSNFNANLYDFHHAIHGDFTGTQNELRKRFNLNHSNVSSLCSGRLQSAYGWRIKGRK